MRRNHPTRPFHRTRIGCCGTRRWATPLTFRYILLEAGIPHMSCIMERGPSGITGGCGPFRSATLGPVPILSHRGACAQLRTWGSTPSSLSSRNPLACIWPDEVTSAGFRIVSAFTLHSAVALAPELQTLLGGRLRRQLPVSGAGFTTVCSNLPGGPPVFHCRAWWDNALQQAREPFFS